jgi:8-oxo-dGTP pyrophosphatase MutT (NUDIX family)
MLAVRGLAGMLQAYEPEDEVEAVHRRRMLALVANGKNAFSRDRYLPGHFTASAFVLSPDEQALLFVFHRRLRQWLQPGGHIDRQDEDVFAAACREVVEETGVARLRATDGPPALFNLDVHRIPAHRDEPAHQHFDVRFLLQAEGWELEPHPEVRDARWVKVTEVGALDPDISIRRAVAKLERRLAAG